MKGLLINGQYFSVDGLNVYAPGELPFIMLDPGDRMMRTESWIRQIIIHTTKGIWPQHIIPGVGPAGKGKVVADFWRNDPNHSAAQIVIDCNGDVYCLCDLRKFAAYHATTANNVSIGIEMYQMNDGGIYEATLISCVKLIRALCRFFKIPYQGCKRPYNRLPLKRMITKTNGTWGADCVGVFGHRDNAWDFKKLLSTRGQGDPGDLIFDALFKDGMAAFDYTLNADLTFWTNLQKQMNDKGAAITVDGICGPSTYNTALRLGFWKEPEMQYTVN